MEGTVTFRMRGPQGFGILEIARFQLGHASQGTFRAREVGDLGAGLLITEWEFRKTQWKGAGGREWRELCVIRSFQERIGNELCGFNG